MSAEILFLVNWLPLAEELLLKRDRFTRDKIKSDFAKNPQKDALPVDVPNHLFATPVANNRFTVIWQLAGDAAQDQIANVKAVVPTQFRTDNPERLRQQIQEVIELEADGKVSLE